jgi:ankyrin repeat protein
MMLLRVSRLVVSLTLPLSLLFQFGNTALMIASNQGDFLKVRTLCEQKADVNKQDKVSLAANHGGACKVYLASSEGAEAKDEFLE